MTRSFLLSAIAIAIVCACGGATDGSSSGANGASNNDPNDPNGSSGPSAGTTPGRGTSPSDPGTNVCSGFDEAACDDGYFEADSAEALIAEIKTFRILKDSTIHPSFGTELRPSGDIYVTKTIEVTGADLRKAHSICTMGPPPPPISKCFDWTFAPEKPFHATQNQVFGHKIGTVWPKGVECLEPGTEGRDGCERIRIQGGTMIRIQNALEPFYFMGSQRYYVRILRHCDATCAADELHCSDSNTCIRGGKDFCILCEGKDEKTCACRDGCKAKLDGTKCSYHLSDDHGGSGTCSSGVCSGGP